MRILQINKFHHIEGGTERYYWELSNLLKKKGHEVAFFSMQDPRNFPTKWSKYFVDFLSFRDVNYKDSIKIAGRMIYSLEAKKKINQLLDIFHPDIVHIHNIYNHISPSILPEIKRRNIPIVQTVHDYHLLAPDRYLFHDNHICEVTRPNKYYKAMRHKCVKNSYGATLMTIIAMYIFKIFKFYCENIDVFITPSNFLREKMIEYGYDTFKIFTLPHFVQTKTFDYRKEVNNKKYVLYFGRFSPEKGLLFLLKVAQRLPEINFKLIGNGSQKELLKSYIKRYTITNVDLLDFQSDDKLQNSIFNSTFTLLPSIWYEVLGLSILESFASGKPVIASNIGGIPELIKNDKTGFLFEPNDIEDCVSKIKLLWENPLIVRKMGNYSIKYVKKNFNSEDHYKKIINIYSDLIKKYKMQRISK